MSGYLAHLVSRTLGLATQVNPVRRSSFENTPVALTPEAGAEPLAVYVERAHEGPVQSTPRNFAPTTERKFPAPAPGSAPDAAADAEPATRLEPPATPGPSSAPEPSYAPAPAYISLKDHSASREEMTARFDTIMALTAARASGDSRRPSRAATHSGALTEVGHGVSADILDRNAESTTRAERHEARPATGELTAPAMEAELTQQVGNSSTLALTRRRGAPDRITNADVVSTQPVLAPRAQNKLFGEKVPRAATANAKALEAVSIESQDTPPGKAMVLSPAARALTPAASRSAATAERSAPDVHITIGRVEIRAQQPAARPPPAAKAVRAMRPILNLDGYLRQRRGERP